LFYLGHVITMGHLDDSLCQDGATHGGFGRISSCAADPDEAQAASNETIRVLLDSKMVSESREKRTGMTNGRPS
jgi:hypothetical protein